MISPLVSVCVPCYNVAPYIGRLVDSLIAQTHKNLKIIFINDGSTDNTGEIISEYIPRLEAQGYVVNYIVQENAGPGGAINRAIKEVQGDYLTWMDPDDWLTPDSIEKRVVFLEAHPEVAMVRGDLEFILEKGNISSGRMFQQGEDRRPHRMEDFLEMILEDKTYLAAHANMVRMSTFLQITPNREIYVHRKGGQNYQLLIPLAAKYECWQIPDLVGYYLIREGSHSHRDDYAYRIRYDYVHEEVILATLKKLPDVEARYTAAIRKRYADHRFTLALAVGDTKEARRNLATLREIGAVRGKLYLILLARLYLLPSWLYKLGLKLYRKS